MGREPCDTVPGHDDAQRCRLDGHPQQGPRAESDQRGIAGRPGRRDPDRCVLRIPMHRTVVLARLRARPRRAHPRVMQARLAGRSDVADDGRRTDLLGQPSQHRCGTRGIREDGACPDPRSREHGDREHHGVARRHEHGAMAGALEEPGQRLLVLRETGHGARPGRCHDGRALGVVPDRHVERAWEPAVHVDGRRAAEGPVLRPDRIGAHPPSASGWAVAPWTSSRRTTAPRT